AGSPALRARACYAGFGPDRRKTRHEEVRSHSNAKTPGVVAARIRPVGPCARPKTLPSRLACAPGQALAPRPECECLATRLRAGRLTALRLGSARTFGDRYPPGKQLPACYPVTRKSA